MIPAAVLAGMLVVADAHAATSASQPAAPASLAGHRLVAPKLPEAAEDDPDEAQRFFLSKRLAPGMTEYPVAQLLRAQRNAAKLPLYSTRANSMVVAPEGSLAAQSLTWTALGPGNVGGRTRAFVFAPGSSTTIYAAGVAGGVWKSTNTGASWTPLGDAMANLAVTALLIDPHNSNVIYAGTGEGFFNIDRVRGAGIFKSTDGGGTWTQLPATTTSDFWYVNDLAFKPGSSTLIYAATGDGLWQSGNSGTSWTRVIDATNSNGCMKVVYRSDTDTAVASCGTFAPTASSTGIWRSTNAGVAAPTWAHVVGPSGTTQTLANMGRISLAIAPSNQSVMYALIACSAVTSSDCGTGAEFDQGLLAVLQSTNGGASWTAKKTNTFTHTDDSNLLLTNPVIARCSICNACGAGASDSINSQGWYDNVIAVDPLDSTKVWVGGIDLWRSDNSGANWGVASYWWFSTSDTRYAHADHHAIVFDPAFNGSSNLTMYATNDGGLFKTTNARATVGTNSSTNNTNSVCGSSNLSSLSFSNLNNGYGVTQFYHGTVYPGGTQYFAGAQDNGTTRGTDGSPNGWTTILGGDGGFTAIDRNTSGGSTVLYAENTGISIAKSTNNGSTFSCATNGVVGCSSPYAANDCGLFINPFQMDPANTQRLFTSGTRLWRTSNAGGTWTQASAAISGSSCPGGERFSNYAIAPGNSNLLVAGTTAGHICRLTNATSSTSGTALQNCTQPAGSAYISEIAFDPNSSGTTAYATVSTFGAKHVWKSANQGATWSDVSGTGGANPLPDSPAHTVAVSPFNANTIYVGTEIGVFVTTDGGANWSRENTGFANVITDHLVISPTGATGQSIYAFTHGRGVFRAALSGSPIASTTTLGASPNPSVSGQSVTLTASVSGGAGTPTGSVTFLDGGSALASNVALNGSGIATFSTSALSVSSHNLSATYSGSGAYLTSTGHFTQTVNKAGTTTSIIADTPDPSVTRQSVSVTATVTPIAPGSGTPTGTVTVSGSNTTGNCSFTLPAISCSISFTASGAQSISASYSGDGSFTASTSTSASHIVNKASTTLSISDAPDPTLVGANVTVTGSLNVTAPGAGTPTGSIGVTASNSSGCTITLPATSCVLSFTASGTQTIDASYGGDANYNPATAAQIAHSVTPTLDLSITNTDDSPIAVSGGTVSYNIVVVNAGPGTASGAIVTDSPAGLSGASWTCTPTGPASCPHASGSGAISETITLGSGQTLTYALIGTVTGAAGTTLANTALVTAPGGATDTNLANNSSTDLDNIVSDEIFADGFEP
jgi:uncharacterized repeat protein (TIGR01451 family)